MKCSKIKGSTSLVAYFINSGEQRGQLIREEKAPYFTIREAGGIILINDRRRFISYAREVEGKGKNIGETTLCGPTLSGGVS